MKNNKNGGNVRTVDPEKYLEERRNNKAYWAKRSVDKNNRMIEEAEATAKELKKGYMAAETLFEQEVRKVYRGFENAFDLSHAEAKRLIDTAKSDVPSKALLDSINRIADPEKKREMQALVSAPAYKWRISRLDALQKKAQELSTRLYNAELRTDLRFLASQMDEAYKHTIFDLQQGTGVSGAFEVLPESRIKQVLNTKWRGAHFSSRIWGNTQSLVTELRQNLLESFMTGESEQETAARIQERFGVASFEARRLIRTESTYVCGQAELEGYRNSAVERYEYASLDDDRRSKICERLDGKTFPISKAKPGINYPPMHPFCRSSTMAVLPTEEELDKEWDTFIGENVPEGMTFDEWQDGLEPTEDGKLVYTGKSGGSVDISGESGIIRENSKKSITTITDSAIERVPNVDISGYTEEQCLFIQQQHKELLKYSRDNNDNKEVAFVFDGELGNRKEFLGTEDDLDFKNELYGSNLLIMHNHPRNSSFSTTDIIFFCDNINVKTLTIAKNNGNVEYITKSSNYNKDILKLEYSRLYGKIIKQDTDTEKEELIRILLTKTKSGVIWSGR